MKCLLSLLAVSMLLLGCSGSGGGDDEEPMTWDESTWDSDARWQ